LDNFDSFSTTAELAPTGASCATEASCETVPFAEPVRRHLALVDPSALRRDCLKLALAQQARRWRVTDVPAAIDLVHLLRQGAGFSVILLGGATCRHIDLMELTLIAAAAPRTPILATAHCEDPERARTILRSGARGFLPMSLGLKVLVGALERVRAGGTFVPLVLNQPAGDAAIREPSQPPSPTLTKRQRDVLALISEGQSNKLIADALGMSESTVKAHVKQIIRRLHVVNRTQAALLATRGTAPAAAATPAAVLERVL
jgi:DNA-binding NarL/FixJ family response regulator